MYPSSSMENIVYQPPIAKTTSKLLRNMLLSTDRIKFNSSANSSFTTTNNNPYSNYCQVLLLHYLKNNNYKYCYTQYHNKVIAFCTFLNEL